VRKILILTLAMTLSFGMISAARAGTVSVDVWSGGEVDTNLGSYTTDVSQISIGIDLPMDKFKFIGNISSGTVEGANSDLDAAGVLLKGGYSLIDNDQIRIDVIGGFYDRALKIEDGTIDIASFYSLIIGFDTTFKLNKNAWVDFSYCLGIDPQLQLQFYEHDFVTYYRVTDLDSISLLNLKLNYLFTEEFGASLGYQSEKIGITNYLDYTFSGLTIGAFYKF
jgi:hypothetical protein